MEPGFLISYESFTNKDIMTTWISINNIIRDDYRNVPNIDDVNIIEIIEFPQNKILQLNEFEKKIEEKKNKQIIDNKKKQIERLTKEIEEIENKRTKENNSNDVTKI